MKPTRLLSGGQKSRVSFALLAYGKPHILVLDEPTNHLDIETVDALINALQMYTGGLICVTHDQHFVEKVCKDLWVVENKALKKHQGDFKAYKRGVLKLVMESAKKAGAMKAK